MAAVVSESYTVEYAIRAIAGYEDSIRNAAGRQNAVIKVSSELGRYSLKAAIRFIGMLRSDPFSEETVDLGDRLARQCLKGLDVACWLDDRQVGMLAKITDPDNQMLEVDPIFTEWPIFYQAVLDTVTAHILKNFTAPPKDTPGAVAQDRG